LPAEVQALDAYRNAESEDLQALIVGDLKVRWDLLADAARGPRVWKAIARQMGPQALRMNLNTLVRHKVLGLEWRNDMVDYVANRIADVDEIRRSRQFPYQYLAAYLNAGDGIPHKIKVALENAAEIACGNVPELPGPVVIGLDTSGSMSSPVTGHRGRGATSVMRCVDVAALFAAAILRRNPDSMIVPFDTRPYIADANASDSILRLSARLAKYGGGGTDCSIPLREANTRFRDKRFAGAVLVSDCESWVYRHRHFAHGMHGSTGVVTEWQSFVKNQLRLGGHDIVSPKLVCIDIQAYGTTQAPEREDILNIGGFSDAVFNVVSAFLSNEANRFVTEVESMEL
jgi:60 kDa SS-A/Ro ribonucleoprotein